MFMHFFYWQTKNTLLSVVHSPGNNYLHLYIIRIGGIFRIVGKLCSNLRLAHALLVSEKPGQIFLVYLMINFD
jgi:hypothetical protein